MTTVSAYSYSHSTTYVVDNILKSLKDIIAFTGLSPEKFVEDWVSTHTAISTWIKSGHLEKVILEIYDASTDALVGRWDIDISYDGPSGDGSFWTDTEQIRYAIKKAGLSALGVKYGITLRTSAGRPDVAGWVKGSLRSTAGFVRQSLGSMIEHGGLGASASFWRNI